MKRMVLFFCCIVNAVFACACTTFLINKNGQLVFGRNYDWVTGSGLVCVNQRGLFKTSVKTADGAAISWLSLYGSVTFNQYGKEFPTGGMNEKGVVVELMWLDGTTYPVKDNRPAIGVLQWVQYQLDNCSTVDEIIATDKKLRITRKETAPLHYLVADAKGNAATIEFIDGKMMVHRNDALPYAVLTNNRYDESIQRAKTVIGNNGSINYATGNNSIDRFATACSMLKQVETTTGDISLTDYGFRILDKVAQGTFTKWSIVYNISNKNISFKTAGFQQIKTINFSSFGFNCGAASMACEMNQPNGGDIRSLFEPFSITLNRNLVEKSMEESRSQIDVTSEDWKALWEYPQSVVCK